MKRFLVCAGLLAVPVSGQADLSLPDAVRIALEKHPSLEAGAERVLAARRRIEQARSGWLPRLNYTESWARSNNPVFVFSSLLTQRQFTERNFQIGPLNRPDFLNNFQSLLTVDQLIYDFGQLKGQTRSAELGRSLAEEDRRRMEMQVIAGVVRAYLSNILAAEALQVAREAVKSAEADLRRAETVRAAGMATDADVLSIRVHLAAMREQEIRGQADVQVAAAALNEALGLPLETPHRLTTPLTAAALAVKAVAEREQTAFAGRPEIRQARLATQLAEAQRATARAALLPQLSFRTALEADRQNFVTKGGANWLVAASLRWNLFNGFETRARIDEAGHAAKSAAAQERQVKAGVALEIRKGEADLQAASERIAVAEAAVAMAEESLRITRHRYEAGLATVTDLLRNETALLEARMRRLAAVHDQRMAAVVLELVSGVLTRDSEVLR